MAKAIGTSWLLRCPRAGFVFPAAAFVSVGPRWPHGAGTGHSTVHTRVSHRCQDPSSPGTPLCGAAQLCWAGLQLGVCNTNELLKPLWPWCAVTGLESVVGALEKA